MKKAHANMRSGGEREEKNCIVDILAKKKVCFRCKTTKGIDVPVHEFGLCAKCFIAKDPEFERKRIAKLSLIGTNSKIKYKGKTKLLKEWAKEYNMGICTLINRFARGMTQAEAFNTPVEARHKARQSGTYKGETKTLVEWSQQAGFDNNTVRDRVKQGWSLKKAMETPLRKRNK